jgi:hypothetical protein
MQVTNVNDVRVYNLTCSQKAVPQVWIQHVYADYHATWFTYSGLLMKSERNWRKMWVSDSNSISIVFIEFASMSIQMSSNVSNLFKRSKCLCWVAVYPWHVMVNTYLLQVINPIQQHLLILVITDLGAYKPRVRCYDVNELSLKFERCFDHECVQMKSLSEDYSKVRWTRVIRLYWMRTFLWDCFHACKSLYWIPFSSRQLSYITNAETRKRFRLSIFIVWSLLCWRNVCHQICIEYDT